MNTEINAQNNEQENKLFNKASEVLNSINRSTLPLQCFASDDGRGLKFSWSDNYDHYTARVAAKVSPLFSGPAIRLPGTSATSTFYEASIEKNGEITTLGPDLAAKLFKAMDRIQSAFTKQEQERLEGMLASVVFSADSSDAALGRWSKNKQLESEPVTFVRSIGDLQFTLKDESMHFGPISIGRVGLSVKSSTTGLSESRVIPEGEAPGLHLMYHALKDRDLKAP